MLRELTDFSGPDKATITGLLKTELLSRCMTGPDSISISTAALHNVQKKLEAVTGFGSQAMMHSAGKALSNGLKPKIVSESGALLETMGFGMRALELSETGLVVYADAYGLDYLFLGILEGLANRAMKKETRGALVEPGVFKITTR
jgi:hypothetical protein